MISRAGQTMLRQARMKIQQRRHSPPVASLSALARLLSSLAILEQKDGKLNHSSLGSITAAQKLGGSITGFLAGSNIKGAAEEAAKVAGIQKVISVENVAYDKVRPPSTDLHPFALNILRDYPKTTLLCLSRT